MFAKRTEMLACENLLTKLIEALESYMSPCFPHNVDLRAAFVLYIMYLELRIAFVFYAMCLSHI